MNGDQPTVPFNDLTRLMSDRAELARNLAHYATLLDTAIVMGNETPEQRAEMRAISSQLHSMGDPVLHTQYGRAEVVAIMQRMRGLLHEVMPGKTFDALHAEFGAPEPVKPHEPRLKRML